MRFQISEKRLVFFAEETPHGDRRVEKSTENDVPVEAGGTASKQAVSAEPSARIGSFQRVFQGALELLRVSGSHVFRQPTAGGQKKFEGKTHHPNLYLIPYEHYLLKRKNLLRDLGIHCWDSLTTCREKLLNDLRTKPRIQAHKSGGLVYLLNGYSRYFYAKELDIPDDRIPVTTPDGVMMLAEYLNMPEK